MPKPLKLNQNADHTVSKRALVSNLGSKRRRERAEREALRALLSRYVKETFTAITTENDQPVEILAIGKPKPSWRKLFGYSHAVEPFESHVIGLPLTEAGDDFRRAVTGDGTLVAWRTNLRDGEHTILTKWGISVKRGWQVMPLHWLYADEVRSYTKQLKLYFQRQLSSTARAI